MSEPSDPSLRAVQRAAPGWRCWAGDQSCTPAARERPATLGELRAAIGRAAERDWKVRVAGSGHSFSDIACSDGLMLSLDRLTGLIDVDRSSGLARVRAGTTIRELGLALDEHGLALENVGDIDAQTIAGAISTATHGTGAALRNLAAQVSELTLVLADSSTLTCSEEADAEVWRAARGSLRALGGVAGVTLRWCPAFTLHGLDAPAPLAEVLERFE